MTKKQVKIIAENYAIVFEDSTSSFHYVENLFRYYSELYKCKISSNLVRERSKTKKYHVKFITQEKNKEFNFYLINNGSCPSNLKKMLNICSMKKELSIK